MGQEDKLHMTQKWKVAPTWQKVGNFPLKIGQLHVVPSHMRSTQLKWPYTFSFAGFKQTEGRILEVTLRGLMRDDGQCENYLEKSCEWKTLWHFSPGVQIWSPHIWPPLKFQMLPSNKTLQWEIQNFTSWVGEKAFFEYRRYSCVSCAKCKAFAFVKRGKPVCDNVYCGEFKPLRFKPKSQNALEKQRSQAQKKVNELKNKLKRKAQSSTSEKKKKEQKEDEGQCSVRWFLKNAPIYILHTVKYYQGLRSRY